MTMLKRPRPAPEKLAPGASPIHRAVKAAVIAMPAGVAEAAMEHRLDYVERQVAYTFGRSLSIAERVNVRSLAKRQLLRDGR